MQFWSFYYFFINNDCFTLHNLSNTLRIISLLALLSWGCISGRKILNNVLKILNYSKIVTKKFFFDYN